MNNQEATEMIRNDMKLHHDYLSGKYRKALSMAIEALRHSPTQMSGTSDPISRQVAIDTEGLDEEIRCEMCIHTNRGCNGCCRYDEKLYKRIMQILDERIKTIYCKNCKFSNEDIFDRGLYCKHEGALFDVEDNHYCSWAERK